MTLYDFSETVKNRFLSLLRLFCAFKRKMPLFSISRKSAKKEETDNTNHNQDNLPRNELNSFKKHFNGVTPKSNGEVTMAEQPQKQKLVFHCQQAQGSPTGLISGFTNVKELYEKISECYDFPPEDILYCTLNTHKVDMTKLLGGQIGLEDFIFVHRKGRAKEIEITKSEDALGLTITDNGAGYAFIKRIKEGSIIDSIEYIQVGDHIEKIDNINLIGRRHFEVAKLLKDIPRGTTFTIRLIEPLKAGFSNIEARSNPRKGKKPGFGTGKETLRFKANGKCQIEEEASGVKQVGIENINQLLENFMGINDTELATQIWEQAEGKTNSMDFAEAIDNSDLEEFGFNDDFIIELWGVITDARSGRLQSKETH